MSRVHPAGVLARAAQLAYRLQAFEREGCSTRSIVAAAVPPRLARLPPEISELGQVGRDALARKHCSARNLSNSSSPLGSCNKIVITLLPVSASTTTCGFPGRSGRCSVMVEPWVLQRPLLPVRVRTPIAESTTSGNTSPPSGADSSR